MSQSSDQSRPIGLLFATDDDLARRLRLVERKLRGSEPMTLADDPVRLADEIAAVAQILDPEPAS